MSVGDVAALVAVLLSIGSLALAWRKAPNEQRALDAEGALKYAQASGMTAEQNTKLLQRVSTLETEVIAIRSKLDDRDRLIADWQVGIGRLVMQVGSMGGTPVWQPNMPNWLDETTRGRDDSK